MEEINISPKKIVGQHYYIVELTELKKIADDEKWVCKYDDVREEDDDDEEFIDELDEVKIEVKPDDEELDDESNVGQLIEELEKII